MVKMVEIVRDIYCLLVDAIWIYPCGLPLTPPKSLPYMWLVLARLWGQEGIFVTPDILLTISVNVLYEGWDRADCALHANQSPWRLHLVNPSMFFQKVYTGATSAFLEVSLIVLREHKSLFLNVTDLFVTMCLWRFLRSM